MLNGPAVPDVVVFDADRVQDLATYTDPHRYSVGNLHWREIEPVTSLSCPPDHLETGRTSGEERPNILPAIRRPEQSDRLAEERFEPTLSYSDHSELVAGRTTDQRRMIITVERNLVTAVPDGF